MAPTLLTVYPGDENAAVYAGTGGASFTNLSGTVTVLYADNPAVENVPDGSISPGASVTLYETVWLYAPARAEVYVVPVAASGTSGGADYDEIVFTTADFVNVDAPTHAGWAPSSAGSFVLQRSGVVVCMAGFITWTGPADLETYPHPLSEILPTGAIPQGWGPRVQIDFNGYAGMRGGDDPNGSPGVTIIPLAVYPDVPEVYGGLNVYFPLVDITETGRPGWMTTLGDFGDAHEGLVDVSVYITWITAP